MAQVVYFHMPDYERRPQVSHMPRMYMQLALALTQTQTHHRSERGWPKFPVGSSVMRTTCLLCR